MAAARKRPKTRTDAALRSSTGMRPHDFQPDPMVPGWCCATAPDIGRTCHLPRANALHDPEAIAAHQAQLAARRAERAAAQDESRRRAGDR